MPYSKFSCTAINVNMKRFVKQNKMLIYKELTFCMGLKLEIMNHTITLHFRYSKNWSNDYWLALLSQAVTERRN